MIAAAIAAATSAFAASPDPGLEWFPGRFLFQKFFLAVIEFVLLWSIVCAVVPVDALEFLPKWLFCLVLVLCTT